MVNNGQLLLFSTVNRGLFDVLSGYSPGIQCIKNRGAKEDRKKQSDYIHTYTEEERLPATDRRKRFASHWIGFKFVFKGYGQ